MKSQAGKSWLYDCVNKISTQKINYGLAFLPKQNVVLSTYKKKHLFSK